MCGRRGSFGRKTINKGHVHNDTMEARKIKARRDSNSDNNVRNDDQHET
jgi:hypothetical protein